MRGFARLFADDTALFYPNKSIDSIIDDMESDLAILNIYFRQNLLLLNLCKTKFMVFHSMRRNVPSHRQPTFDNITIEKVHNFKYLGVVFDSTLSWDKHIQGLEHKISALCGVLWKVKSIIPRHTYFTFIRREPVLLVLWQSVFSIQPGPGL